MLKANMIATNTPVSPEVNVALIIFAIVVVVLTLILAAIILTRTDFVKDSGLVLEDDASLLEGGIIDSVVVLEPVAFLEETFSFRVEDEEIVPENLDSINKLVTYVQLKLTNNNLAVA